nr:MAG TPA: hypothetical protein [Caudoviricetes sp.]
MKENYDNENDSEIDKPLNSNALQSQDVNMTRIIPSKEADNIERKANFYDRMDKHIYKHHGFRLLIGCGIIYLTIIILDTVISNLWNWNASELTTGFVELIKFVISTLIGYVFSETQKHKNE